MKPTRHLLIPALAALCSFPAMGQPAPIQFEVADVHSSPRTNQPIVRGPFYSTGRYELRFATMLDLIRIAYNVDPEKVSGGPSWLEMDRFDVFAKIPAESTVESRRLMLQNLLADRFKLAFHNDSQPMAAYALTVGKHQLKPAEGDGQAGCTFVLQNAPQNPAGGGPIQLPTFVNTCKAMTMEGLARQLLLMPGAGQYFSNRLVIDQTKLEGTWDFTLRYTPKVPAGIQTTGDPVTVFEAVEKQLGLKLEMSTVPLPVMVVDRVNQKPTENSAETMKSFPPLPAEFEVASLKPSAPETNVARGGDAGPRPDIRNGRLYLPGMPLKALVSIAWELNGDERLVGAPKWMDEDRYDIQAKVPADVAMGEMTPSARNGIPFNIDALRPMIQALIIERFQMKAHMENRPLTAYTLVANKPKLKKAEPTSRTKWQEGALPENTGNKNANPTLGRLVTCQNVTMAQFAEMLPRIAPGYLRTDVLDTTGLEGGWDFTFSFSPIGALEMARPRTTESGGAPLPEASEPSAAMSLFDALNRQLGLKLETTKRPMPVLVIEHIERKPIDN